MLYFHWVKRPAAVAMKMQKSAVFRGAAASWTGYPAGRTRSFFHVLPAKVIANQLAGGRLRKWKSGPKGFYPNSAKPSGCCNDFAVMANIQTQSKPVICLGPSLCLPYKSWQPNDLWVTSWFYYEWSQWPPASWRLIRPPVCGSSGYSASHKAANYCLFHFMWNAICTNN